jgi:hypothetical protein
MEDNCWADQNSHRVVASMKKKEQTSTNVSTDTRTTHTSNHDSTSSFKVYALKLTTFHVIWDVTPLAVKQLLMFWKITAPVILVTITVHHTQTERHIMAIYRLTWHFLQRKTFHSESSHIQWDETSTAVNQNQCGSVSSIWFLQVLVGSHLACTLYRKMQYFGWDTYYE